MLTDETVPAQDVRHTLEWLEEFGLSDACAHGPYRRSFLLGQRHLYPTATGARAELLNDWVAWLLSPGRTTSPALELAVSAAMSLSVERRLCPVHPIGGMLQAPALSAAAVALRDLCGRTITFLDFPGADGLLARILELTLTCDRETSQRRAGFHAPLDYRIYQRRRTSGAALLLELRRLAEDCTTSLSLPPGRPREKGGELEVIAADIIAWSADLAEHGNPGYPHSTPSLVTVIERELRTGERDAVSRVVDMIEQRGNLFDHVAAVLQESATGKAKAAAKFIEGLRTLTLGYRRMLGG
ncbi:terpene synthase family protein [Streptomyces spectabilis]|uniref:Uncharacterized protein n=1 Tax=Streptomyces spectabilis TaxID=68270 RepID=A0A7W8B3R0_STRST|nr:hypothetical protein [Streptomyces spectabilis]MBB5109800.1 hypothetical protein [Streptomyces spectabilis]GGV55633.1 hypothetical protein GCM10010245_88280 [Streptomyces spectabilis]